jgi:hypothetical protein
MVSRRRRLGKYATVCFADPPWNEDHPDWIRFDEELPADHRAREMVRAMQVLDLTPLFDSYSAGGTRPIRPDLMLRVVLIETQDGRYRPSQWFRDLGENISLMWAGFGIRPSRSSCYEFADRVAPFLELWSRQLLDECKRRSITPAKRVALDGSTAAANASRHRLLNEEKLAKREAELEQARAADAAATETESLPRWMAKTPRGRIEQQERLKKARVRLKELQRIARRQQLNRRRAPEKIVVSASDPEAAPGRDKMKVFRPLYNMQLVRDLDSPLIFGYELFPQVGDEGTFKPILRRLWNQFGVAPATVLTDAGYVSGCTLAHSRIQGVKVCGPWKENDSSQRKKKAKSSHESQKFPKEKFEWLPAENAYRCPEGHRLTPIGKERREQSDGEVHMVYRYRCRPEHCRVCPVSDVCLTNPNRGRSLRRSQHEDVIDAHKSYMQTDVAKSLYKLRGQTVELGFADFKEHRSLQRFSGRGVFRARRQLGLTVLAHNLVTLSKAQPP